VVNSESTESKILTSAKELFIEKGYHDTSMSAIAKEAGLGKGTLYWHFDSKDDLFKKMITKEGRVILAEVKELSESNLPTEDILKKFIQIRVSRMVKHRKASQMFMDNENFTNKEFKKTMLGIYCSLIEELEKIINKGIEEDVFETDRPDKTAAAIMGTINGLCSVVIVGHDDQLSLEENVECIYNLIMDGIEKKGV
jgi:AcrR family transcriptional regulator